MKKVLLSYSRDREEPVVLFLYFLENGKPAFRESTLYARGKDLSECLERLSTYCKTDLRFNHFFQEMINETSSIKTP